MNATRITKADYIERQPEIEDVAETLQTETKPKLAARVQREYWWNVEYLWWEESQGGWYGCVQNWQEGAWETTAAGTYTDGFWSALCDAVDPNQPQTLQLVPIAETPAERAER